MIRDKALLMVLMALCCLLVLGGQAQCSEDNLFDLGAYLWMPLTEGNTKTFQSSTWENPLTNEPYFYTQKVQGRETVKGQEAVKVIVTDSNIPMGIQAVGSYEAFLPDQSTARVKVKQYLAGNPTYGIRASYQLPTPFARSLRFVKEPVEGDWFQVTGIATCFDDNVDIFGQKKTYNEAIDTSTAVVTIAFLGFEDVTVPAGTFTDCMKYAVTISSSYAQNPKNNVGMKVISWSARGIGEVKSEMVSMMMANEADFYPFNTIQTGGIYELVSATIDGVSYPKQ
jgi:hypothetical protein